MEKRVKDDIVVALREAYDALKAFDIAKLNKVSNLTTHNAGIYQDPHSVTFAILVYSLAKVCSRERERDYTSWKSFKKRTLELLKDAKKDMVSDNHKGYDKDIKQLFKLIGSLDKKLSMYATEVVRQARLKKGEKMYEHGISAGRVAELMGVTEWELQSYVGTAGIREQVWSRKPVSERLKAAKKLFRKKK